MKYNKVVGIDPGIGGGIAIYANQQLGTAKMPSYKITLTNGKKRNETNIAELGKLLTQHKADYTPIVFLELVQAWTGKDDPSRQFQISRMLANFEAIKTAIIMTGLDLVVVRPQDWQTFLNLKVKGEAKELRKKRYVRFAQSKYPSTKATLWNADAICLVEFGRRKLAFDPQWIHDRLPPQPEKTLF